MVSVSEYHFKAVLEKMHIKCGLSVLCAGTFPTWDTLVYYLTVCEDALKCSVPQVWV